MRQTNALQGPNSSRTMRFGARQAMVFMVVAAAVIWGGGAFAQEAYVGHKLQQQVAALRSQNAVLATQNQAFSKDVQGISSGTASEEEARLHGYARPNERLIQVEIVASPSPSPSASPKGTPTASPRAH
jgi:cell division protein FtsB